MVINVTGTYTLVPDPSWATVNTDEIRLNCDTSTAAVTIILPEISALNGLSTPKIFVIDKSLNAATNNITIQASGSDKIGSDTSELINVNGGGIEIQVGDTTNWFATKSAEMGGGGGSSPFEFVCTNSIRPVLGNNDIIAGTYGNYQVIGGGCNNTIDSTSSYGDFNIIGGGNYNSIDGDTRKSHITGGYGNYIIAGSSNNNITGEGNSIYGGYGNNTIGGGYAHSITGSSSCGNTIGGGKNFDIYSDEQNSGIFSGVGHELSSGCYNFIGGGQGNNIDTSNHSAIVSGSNNGSIGSSCSVILGGTSNSLYLSLCSAILGGVNNTASTYNEVFILGSNITADASCTTFVNQLSIKNIPISSVGLPAGAVWNDLGTLKIV